VWVGVDADRGREIRESEKVRNSKVRNFERSAGKNAESGEEKREERGVPRKGKRR